MRLSDFSYDLPGELIASHPLNERTASRLLTLQADQPIQHRMFVDLLSLIGPNDCLVFNNTRVMRARLFGQKRSGGRVELLVERVLSPTHFFCHIKASKAPKPNTELLISDQHVITVLNKNDSLYECKISEMHDATIQDIMASVGEIPLPHYMNREAEVADLERYQTVYASQPGAVAAPTAGLHFDEALLSALKAKGVRMAEVTLHVGAGTFQPVRVENIHEHQMHAEWYQVTPEVVRQVEATRQAGGRVIAVGTTTLRTLESASRSGELVAESAETNLFITPGYHFKQVDALITNFHLPQSTLLMLVCAFAGYDRMMNAYREAVQAQYRFFSYGDAMFIERAQSNAV